MGLLIRKGKQEDVLAAAEIYDAILTKEEQETVYTNWKKGLYPTGKDAQKALEEGTFYVGEEDGKVVACVNLNQIQPTEYEKIPWSITAYEKEVLVIHTLCIHPDCSGRGYGKRFVAFAEQLAKELGCKTIRIDTYEGNFPAAALYQGLGYCYTGSTLFHFQNLIWENLKCFDKKI